MPVSELDVNVDVENEGTAGAPLLGFETLVDGDNVVLEGVTV